RGTVVAGVPDAVAVPVRLTDVADRGAAVARVADPVLITVLLERVGNAGTVVCRVGNMVGVLVGTRRLRGEDTLDREGFDVALEPLDRRPHRAGRIIGAALDAEPGMEP